MHGITEQLIDRAYLGQLAQVEDRGPIAHMLDHGKVVGDQDHGQAEVALEFGEQVEDLPLHRHVQRRNRFIGDDQFGFEREGGSDPDPLALATREFVGQPLRKPARQADSVEQGSDAGRALGGRADPKGLERLADRVRDRPTGIEGGVRVLEDRLDPPAKLTPRPAAQVTDLLAVEPDLPAGRSREPEDAPGQRRLA